MNNKAQIRSDPPPVQREVTLASDGDYVTVKSSTQDIAAKPAAHSIATQTSQPPSAAAAFFISCQRADEQRGLQGSGGFGCDKVFSSCLSADVCQGVEVRVWRSGCGGQGVRGQGVEVRVLEVRVWRSGCRGQGVGGQGVEVRVL
ncbi:kinesin-like protein KIF26A, partial [Lates japonicus]